MMLSESVSKPGTYRLLGDVLATVPRREPELRIRLLIAMAGDAYRSGDREKARAHLDDALQVLKNNPNAGQGLDL